MLRLGVLGSWILAACATPNPLYCADDTPCSDPARPYCDLGGEIAGNKHTCIKVSCGPGDPLACLDDATSLVCIASGADVVPITCANGCVGKACAGCEPGTTWCDGDGNVRTCDAGGAESVRETCSVGCATSPTPHCQYLAPSYLPDICDHAATSGARVVSSDTTLDTSSLPSCNGGILMQVGDPRVCVLRYSSFSLASGVTLTAQPGLTSEHRPALAIVVDDELAIHGILDASADARLDGAGGGVTSSGSVSTTALVPATSDGGGGAGGATAGSVGCGASSGGEPATGPALLSILRGGARAGTPDDERGGGGGGALMLVSCHGSIVIDGIVSVGGGGGIGGGVDSVHVPQHVSGGGGGGAGGTLVITGLDLTLTGEVYANGGGGGAGPYCMVGVPCESAGLGGSAGRAQPLSAAGGFSYTSYGGDGGYSGMPPTPARCDPSEPRSMAGGGGSVGFIEIELPSTVSATISPRSASPAVSTLRAATLR